MTPRSLMATADEVRAIRGGCAVIRRPAKTPQGIWAGIGDPVSKPPYSMGAKVGVREPYTDVDGVRVYRADATVPRQWRAANTLPVTEARYRFEVIGSVCEPLHKGTGDAEGIEFTRFWRPQDTIKPGEKWGENPFQDDWYFWNHYPKLAYSRWWDCMWARFGLSWETNPMTW